ncbi:MAG: hypothetical protein ACJ8R9_32310 [Steroidobacteraceae bacterium]
MKRHTDVSRLRPAAVQESAETGTRSPGCDAAIERAALLLVQGLQQSDIPISQLSNALARMARALTDIGTPLFGPVNILATADVQALRDAFARDIAVCIENLQFHDRLMQQLIQARDLLTGVGVKPLLATVPARPSNEGSIEGSIELF